MATEQEILDLIAAFCDPDLEKRHAAIAALKEIGEPAVSPLISAMAKAPDNDQRWYAATALSRIGEPSVIPLIMAMEANTDRDFRKYAAAALGLSMVWQAMILNSAGFYRRPSAGSANLRSNTYPAGSMTRILQ